MITSLTVLTDPACPLCRRFADWLGRQPTLVPLELVRAGSEEARRRWPELDHASTLEDITVVGSDGSVWTKEHAWVMCLWATRPYRGLADRLGRPHWLPAARGAALSAAGMRHLLTRGEVERDGYPDACAGSCPPIAQG